MARMRHGDLDAIRTAAHRVLVAWLLLSPHPVVAYRGRDAADRKHNKHTDIGRCAGGA